MHCKTRILLSHFLLPTVTGLKVLYVLDGIRWRCQKPCPEYAASHSVGKSNYILPMEGGFSLDRPVVEGGRVNLYTGCHMIVITSVLEVIREHSAPQSQKVDLKART